MPDHFASARLKIERAKKHIVDVDAIIRSLPAAYVSTIENDQKTGHRAIRYVLPNELNVSLELALIIGDAIHNLRTSLDYVWIATIKKFAPFALGKHTKFPVTKSREELEAKLKGIKIHVAAPTVFERIVSDIKPYSGGHEFIYRLHELDISDKHWLLTPLMHVTAIMGIVIEDEHGERISGDSWAVTGPGPHFIPIQKDWKVEERGRPTVAVVFENGSAMQFLDVHDMLSSFSVLVLGVIEQLEYL
jgi:hypothetical protein